MLYGFNDKSGLLNNTVSNPRAQCIPDAFAFLIFKQYGSSTVLRIQKLNSVLFIRKL